MFCFRTAIVCLLLSGLLTGEASAQLFRGGLIRRMFGRDAQEEQASDKKGDEKSGPKGASRARADRGNVPSPPDLEQLRKNPVALGRNGGTRLTVRGGAAAVDREFQADSSKFDAVSPRQSYQPQRLELFGMTLTTGPRNELIQVKRVERDSYADRAGVSTGDEVIEIGGIKTSNLAMLEGLSQDLTIGDRLPIKLLRDGQEVLVTIVYGGAEKTSSRGAENLVGETAESVFPRAISDSRNRFDGRQREPLVLDSANAPAPDAATPPKSSSILSRQAADADERRSTRSRSMANLSDFVDGSGVDGKANLNVDQLLKLIERQQQVIKRQSEELRQLRSGSQSF